MAKKKGKGRTSTHMTAAERTRAKMRAQQQAEEARQQAEGRAAAEPAAIPHKPTQAKSASAQTQIDDIDAQIAELERRKAKLAGESRAQNRGDTPSKPAKAEAKGTRETGSGTGRQAYPGEKKLRRAQGKLEGQAASWDSNPTVNRIVCALIDLFAGGICLLGPVYLTYYYMSGNNTMTSLTDFTALGQPALLAVALALLGLALGVLYYVVVPWKMWPGQTLGKHLGHIRIVRRDRRELGLGTIVLRQLVGVMFLELGLTCDLMLLPQLVTLCTGNASAGSALQVAGLAITAVSVVTFFASKRRLALHDRFAGTRVEQL